MTVTELIEKFNNLDGSPRHHLLNVLAAQCYFGQADGGAVLRIDQEKDIGVLALYPPLEEGESAPQWLTKSAGYARQSLSSNKVLVRPLDELIQLSTQPSKTHIVMVPSRVPDVDGVVVAFLLAVDDKILLEASTQKLQLLTGMLGAIQARTTQENWQESCRRLRQTIEALSAVNRQDRFTAAAMAFCNEAASQWQCERVSIGFLVGRYVQLKAISHTEHFSRKMEAVRDIESVMEECVDQDIEVLCPVPKGSNYISRAAQRLSQRYGPLSVLSLPLRRGEEAVAVLTLERPADKNFGVEEVETIRLACEMCTARIVGLREHDRWIGATIAARIRESIAGLLGPKHTWAKVAAILCSGAILFLMFAKGQYRPDAPFVIEATYRQVVPAPFDGYIKDVYVEIGDTVVGGSTVLGSLDTAELRLNLAAAKADKAGYRKQVSAAMRDGKTAEAQIAQADVDKMQAQIELLEYQISQASLVSQTSGVVVEGDLKREIGAPVETGKVLFEVCPLESLRAQLMVPEDEIYDLSVGQKGYLATASYPGQRIKFVVERISPVAEVVNQRNVFKVRVQLLETYPWLRPGMEGVAKVSVGRRHYAWIWTRRIINWIRMKFWL